MVIGSGESHPIIRKKQVEVVAGDSFQSILNGVIANGKPRKRI